MKFTKSLKNKKGSKQVIKMKLNLTDTNLFSGLYETIWLNDYSLEDETGEGTVNRKNI